MIARRNEAEPFIAYVYGATSPDFGAIAAMGFDIVCLDTRAPWYTPGMIEEAKKHDLIAVAHPMSFSPVIERSSVERSVARTEKRVSHGDSTVYETERHLP